MKKLIVRGIAVILVAVLSLSGIIFSLAQSENDKVTNHKDILSYKLYESEGMDEILRLYHGEQKNQVGFRSRELIEGDFSTGVTSFFIRNQVYYLLDNVNKKIVIKTPQNIENIYLPSEYC